MKRLLSLTIVAYFGLYAGFGFLFASIGNYLRGAMPIDELRTVILVSVFMLSPVLAWSV